MGRKRVETLLGGAEATQEFATRFARDLPPNAVIALSGELGAGKTTFVKGLVYGLGGSIDWVQSPTFVYLHQYPTKLRTAHFDLYRMRSAADFLAMGFEEYFENGGITAIEWPERIASILPASCIKIELCIVSETQRLLVIT